jgi:TolB-like protein/Tfp pilus assembly protein PilF
LGAAIAKVAAAIQDPVGLPSGAVSGVTAGRGSAQQFKSLRSRILPLIGLFVLGLAATVLLAHRFWSPNSATERIGMTSLDSLSDKSIAVLPFADMSEKKDQDYLADGTAEEILDLLAKIPGIAVIGRTSSFQFKDKNVDLRTIGSQLKAAHVLEGSIRRTGDQVRITAQLINSTTGTHEWSETYNRQIGDVLKLQDSIAAAVVREMQLSVAPYALASRPTLKSPEAYDLYLRGRHAGDRWDEQGLDEAISLFRQALDRDPNSAETLAHLANAYLSQATGTLTPAESIEQARSNATKAMTLDSKNVLAHVVMEQIHFIYEWDWVGAEREITEAMKAAPGDGDVLYGEAYLSEILGRWDDALRYINGALAEDPLNPIFLVGLSWIQESRGHLLEAEAALHRALAIRPTFESLHEQLGVLLLESGDRNGALREMQQEIADTNKQEGLALAYYALGRKAEADAELAAMLKAQSVGNADGIAEVYAFRHQLDDSMHWLERAYAQKDQSLHYIKRDWLLRGLEPDPRYTAFLRKMNFPD